MQYKKYLKAKNKTKRQLKVRQKVFCREKIKLILKNAFDKQR